MADPAPIPCVWTTPLAVPTVKIPDFSKMLNTGCSKTIAYLYDKTLQECNDECVGNAKCNYFSFDGYHCSEWPVDCS